MSLADGTADGSDYTGTQVVVTYLDGDDEKSQTLMVSNGQFSFDLPAGNSGFKVAVQTTSDADAPIYEGDETFILTASTETQSTPTSGQATIQDGGNGGAQSDDDRPEVTQVSSLTVEEGQSATFDVTLSNASELPTKIEMSLADGT
ncbi:hypothetical protein, partial [Vibrio ponticus]